MSFARVDRLLAADRWREALDALDDLETRAPGPLAPVTSAEASARRLAALRHLGDLETAADLARAVIVRARAAGWMHVLQTALRERALCLVELGDAPAAVRLAEEAADLAETAGDLAGLGLAFLAIGDARARWIGPGQAVDSWQAAADTLRVAGTGEPTKSASNAPLSIPLTRLGEQAHREGRLEEARALLDEALAHARGAPLAEAGARWSLAMLLEEQARQIGRAHV